MCLPARACERCLEHQDFYTPWEIIDPETIAAEAATLPAIVAAEFYADLAVFKKPNTRFEHDRFRVLL